MVLKRAQNWALAGPCPRGLGGPVLGPSRRVPKMGLF